jgi:geranylgeranyl pyrophosphate synthase
MKGGVCATVFTPHPHSHPPLPSHLQDRPIIDDADAIRSVDLYPPRAPVLHEDGDAFRVDESCDTLDLSAFPGAVGLDPFLLVGPDLRGINTSIKALLGVDHPVLATVARYFFDFDGGKKVRPALVLLMAHAVNAHAAHVTGARYVQVGSFTPSDAEVVAAADILQNGMPVLPPDSRRRSLPGQVVLPLQRRLAEITELIHTASLLHDDVIDSADVRRGVGSVNKVFGNKLAVLAGDFLLARASVCLARLRSVPAVELLSSVIEHLVKGEVMQMHSIAGRGGKAAFEHYLRKTYYKTGSLMANSCKAIATLGAYPDAVCDAAYKYGLHLGIAFQLVDDLLGERKRREGRREQQGRGEREKCYYFTIRGRCM